MLSWFQHFVKYSPSQSENPDQPGRGSFLGAYLSRFSGRRHVGAANTSVMLIVFVFGSLLLAGLGWRFPEEADRWLANQAKIRQLQEDNASLLKRVQEREQRLKEFNENYLDQELRVRSELNLHKENEKVFVLPPTKPAPQRESAQEPDSLSSPNP